MRSFFPSKLFLMQNNLKIIFTERSQKISKQMQQENFQQVKLLLRAFVLFLVTGQVSLQSSVSVLVTSNTTKIILNFPT